MKRSLLLFMAASLAAPAAAQPSPPPDAPVAQGVSADALALARLVEPAGESNVAALAAVKASFLQMLTSDPDAAALEADYPGIYAAVWDAMEPLMRESIDADTPKLWDKLARLYSERLSPTEIAALHRFYSSPTGRKMVQTVNEKANIAPLIEAMANSPDAEISAEVFRKAQAPGRAAAAADVTAEGEEALKELARSVPLPKLYRVGLEVQRITLAWMNEPDPELDARVDKVIEDRMASFMAAADAKQ